MNNELVPERPPWAQKYTTISFSLSYIPESNRMVVQPILRWLKYSELYYMSWQEATYLECIAGMKILRLLLPSNLLDLCFCTMPKPPPNIAQLITLLAWVSLDESKEYYAKLEAQVMSYHGLYSS